MLNVPTTFTVMTLTKRPRSWGASLPMVRSASAMPAQLTSTCSPPNSFCASATAALPSASLATSVFAKRPPISFASFSPASTCRSAMTTLPPFSAAMRAVAAPRPEAPPAVREESDLLVALAPHVEDFVAKLFGIEDEARALAARHNQLAPLYSVKRLFVQRRALHKVKPEDAKPDGFDFSTELDFAQRVSAWLKDEAASAAKLEAAARYAAW